MGPNCILDYRHFCVLKWHSSFGAEIQTLDFNIYNINEVIIQTQKDRSPDHCLKLERWQGPPQYEKHHVGYEKFIKYEWMMT